MPNVVLFLLLLFFLKYIPCHSLQLLNSNGTILQSFNSPHFPRGITSFSLTKPIIIADVSIKNSECTILNTNLEGNIVFFFMKYSYNCWLENWIIDCSNKGCAGLITNQGPRSSISTVNTDLFKMEPGFFWKNYNIKDNQLTIPLVVVNDIDSQSIKAMINSYDNNNNTIYVKINDGDYNIWREAFESISFLLFIRIFLSIFCGVCSYTSFIRLRAWKNYYKKPKSSRVTNTSIPKGGRSKILNVYMTIEFIICAWRCFYFAYDPFLTQLKFSYQAGHMFLFFTIPFSLISTFLIAIYFEDILTTARLGDNYSNILHSKKIRYTFFFIVFTIFLLQLISDLNRAAILPQSIAFGGFDISFIFYMIVLLCTMILISFYFLYNAIRIFRILNLSTSQVFKLDILVTTNLSNKTPSRIANITRLLALNSIFLLVPVIILLHITVSPQYLLNPQNYLFFFSFGYISLQISSLLQIIAFGNPPKQKKYHKINIIKKENKKEIELPEIQEAKSPIQKQNYCKEKFQQIIDPTTPKQFDIRTGTKRMNKTPSSTAINTSAFWN